MSSRASGTHTCLYMCYNGRQAEVKIRGWMDPLS